MAAKTPRPEEAEEVRIGVVTKLERKYFAHLKEVLGKRGDCELMEIIDPISYDKLNVDTARTLKQRYQIDMIVCVRQIAGYGGIGTRAFTKIISGERVMTLPPITIGFGTAASDPSRLHIGWEKKLVSEQIGPMEKMIEEIYREKRKSKL